MAWSRPPWGWRKDIVGFRELGDGRREYLMHNKALCNPEYIAVSRSVVAAVVKEAQSRVVPNY